MHVMYLSTRFCKDNSATSWLVVSLTELKLILLSVVQY